MKSLIQLYVVMLHTHMPLVLRRISVYIFFILREPSPVKRLLCCPSESYSEFHMLILLDFKSCRIIVIYRYTFLHIYTYVYACVFTTLVDEVVLERFNDTRQIHSPIPCALCIQIDINVITKTALVSISYQFSEILTPVCTPFEETTKELPRIPQSLFHKRQINTSKYHIKTKHVICLVLENCHTEILFNNFKFQRTISFEN